jgi:hypothetical protein
MRLLYYFAQEATPLIAKRLRGLRVEGYPDNDDGNTPPQRELANGLRADELVKAVSWCREPAICEAVRSIVEQTGDTGILVAAYTRDDPVRQKRIKARLVTFLDRLPKDDQHQQWSWKGYAILSDAEGTLHTEAKSLFLHYLETDSVRRRRIVCEVLFYSHDKDWPVEILVPLLGDRRVVGRETHAASEGGKESEVPTRVCDEAASALSRLCPELRFHPPIGTHEQLDRQIEVLRKRLSQPKP